MVSFIVNEADIYVILWCLAVSLLTFLAPGLSTLSIAVLLFKPIVLGMIYRCLIVHDVAREPRRWEVRW